MPEPTTTDILVAINEFAHSVDKRFGQMDHRFENIEQDIAVVKQDMAVVKQDIASTKDELLTHIDGFVRLHETLTTEFSALRARCERMEAFMARVAKQLNMEFTPT